MATATGRTYCITCGKEKATFKCGGCSQEFCYNHLADHKQELSRQLDEVEVNRDLFRQMLTEQTSKPQKHVLIQQIDQWECDSINKIRQTSDEARQAVFKYTGGHIRELETKLTKLTDQLRQSREENDFFETDLRRWNDELTRLTQELARPPNINLRQDATPLVTKICVDIVSASPYTYGIRIDANVKWVQNGITVAGGNGSGDELYQLSSPLGIYVDDDQTVYIADWFNHRIVEWKSGATSGQLVAGGNGSGNRIDQLNSPADIVIDKRRDCFIISDRDNRRIVRWPRRNGTSGQTIISDISCWGLAMDDEGYLYVADCKKHEVRRWRIGDTSGTVIAGGNGEGDRLDQLSGPTYIFIDGDHSVYVSDSNNHRVMKWMNGAKEGIIAAGGQGRGHSLTQLSGPIGLTVDQLGTVYVADRNNHRIVCWPKDSRQGSVVVGDNGQGEQANQLSNPLGLTFDQQGNLYVVDNRNYRVQRFNIDSTSNL